MYIFCNFEYKDELQHIIVEDLRQFGIKYRQKKQTLKPDKTVSKRIFKVPLHLLPTEDVILNNGSQIKVPKFIFQLCNLVKEQIQIEGLFRKAGSNVRQREIKMQLDKKGHLNKDHHIIDLANVLKSFLRELPEPLIPFYFHDTFLHCLRLDPNCAIKLILNVCLLIPLEHLYTLMYLMEFFKNVASFSHLNKMDANNLSIILTPNIMPLENQLKYQSSQRLSHHVRVIQILIENASNIGVVSTDLVNKLTLSHSNECLLGVTGGNDEEKKRKKKRRSGSLTRMFNGLKKIVSGKIGDGAAGDVLDGDVSSSPDLILNTPCMNKSATKRKASDATAISNKKKRNLLQTLPNGNVLPNCYSTPVRDPSVDCADQTPLRIPPSSKAEEPTKRSYLMLSGRRNKIKRSSIGESDVTTSNETALKRLERRWSAVSSATSWTRKKKQPVDELNIENGIVENSNEGVFITDLKNTPEQNPSGPNEEVDEEFVRISKYEYEEIKKRVSAIEKRLSKEFEIIATPPLPTVDDVQVKYEQTLEEASCLTENNASTDQLAKRLSRELKIRRSSNQKVIRSPSARKIGTIRRRSKEFDRKVHLERNQSWHVTPKSALKRGRPNTVFTGLPHPSPSKLLVDPPLKATLGTPECNSAQKLHRSVSLHCQSDSSNITQLKNSNCSELTISNSSWKSADRFFATKTQPSPEISEEIPRASLAKLRSQNAGMVLAKAKLFDEWVSLDGCTKNQSSSSTTFNRNSRQNKTNPNKNSSRRKQKSPNHKKSVTSPKNSDKENLYENVIKKPVSNFSPLKDLNRVDSITLSSPKNTPRIKKALGNKSPKNLKMTSLNLSERKTCKTPMKGIHGLQNATPRKSPRFKVQQV